MSAPAPAADGKLNESKEAELENPAYPGVTKAVKKLQTYVWSSDLTYTT